MLSQGLKMGESDWVDNLVQTYTMCRHFTFNLFVTSKNETTNLPIHEFKVLLKGQRAFYIPFLTVYYFLFIALKTFKALPFHFKGFKTHIAAP